MLKMIGQPIPIPALLVLVASALYAQPIWAQSFDSIAKRGQQALNAAHHDQAREIFENGRVDAQEKGDRDWLAKFTFYQANVDLLEAGLDVGPGVAPGVGMDSQSTMVLARRAAARYQRVLKMRPESGSAMVNLARAFTLLGDRANADDWYRRAIKLKGPKQALFRRQYAEFLEASDPAESAKQRRAVMAAKPSSAKTHRKLMRTYMNPRYADQLADYLHEQVRNGEVLRAQKAALEAINDPQWPDQHKADLMTVVAASLAKQHISPSEFAGSPTAQLLQKVGSSQPDLRVCVDELLQTVDSGARSGGYRWWSKTKQRSTTLSSLIRANARYFDQANQPSIAEKLYRDAVQLRGESDPSAVRDLVDFYSQRGDLNKIKELSETYEYRLFEGKGRAYRAGDVDAIYDYHRTLASIYAYQATRTGDWGSSRDSTSAAFQLEHAYATARGSDRITPDPQLVEYLAQSHEVTRSKAEANRLRLEAAAMYSRTGNPKAAQRVLKPIDVDDLSEPARARYERVARPSLNLPEIQNVPRPQRP